MPGAIDRTGVIQRTPVPPLPSAIRLLLSAKARRAWSLKRTLDTTTETSHAFLLPTTLRPRLGDFNPPAIEAELARIQAEIDAIAFEAQARMLAGAPLEHVRQVKETFAVQAAVRFPGGRQTQDAPDGDEDKPQRETPVAAYGVR